MSKDHLDNEISVSAELTESGVQAKTHSRAMSGFDRLLGAAFDRVAAPLEVRAAEIRVSSAARTKLIEAATDVGIRQYAQDPEMAARALETHLSNIVRRQCNKEGVAQAALEDLSRQPPTVDESQSGPEVLEENFLNRFERYAEDASSEELRERWGRILASEIRSPGRFSPKELRIVDELDADTAKLFERVCAYRFQRLIPTALCEISYEEQTDLVTAGLLVDPGLGQEYKLGIAHLNDGTEVYLIKGDLYAIGFSKSENYPIPQKFQSGDFLFNKDGEFIKISVYLLTAEAFAIASIISDKFSSAASGLMQLASKVAGISHVWIINKYNIAKKIHINEDVILEF